VAKPSQLKLSRPKLVSDEEITMPQRLPHSWHRRLLLGLCLVLAVDFVFGGAAKFYPGDTFFGPTSDATVLVASARTVASSVGEVGGGSHGERRVAMQVG
jgi:hypothetical protein